MSRVATLGGTGPAKLVVRADKRVLSHVPAADGVNSVQATVKTVVYHGQAVRYVDGAGETQLQAVNMIDERPFDQGTPVPLHMRPQDRAALPG